MKNSTQVGMFWVMATLSIAILPQVLTMAPHLIPLVIVPIVWRYLAELKAWKPVPMLLRVAATVIAVFVLVSTYGGLLGRRAAISLLTLMMALKLLETFKVRDARVVASLSLFLCATQFLFTQGILMLFYAGGVVVTALMSMVYLQRREAFSPKGVAPDSGHSLFSELRYSSKLLAMAVPIALAMFVLFPRWGSPMWGVPESSLDAKSGLSDSMSPGSIQDLFMDDSPAFRADFDSLVPMQKDMYWRGPVFWDFDGREWRGTFYSRNLPAEDRPTIEFDSWRYTVQMEPTEQHWIFALDYPVIIPRGVRLTMDYQLYSRRSITQLKSYDMVSNPRFVDSPKLGTTHRGSALKLPEGYNPRTQAMMNQWREEASSDRELVNRVLTHFNQEAFRYTLNPPLLSQHTVDEFLFDTRAGFCEHYASSFTVMMRMAGVPSRVVTGYQGGWFNDLGNYVLVRQSDAHAWAEVWLEGDGWTRVDPTAAVAPSRIEGGSLNALGERRHMFDFQWLRSIRNGFDLIQRGWNQWVIAFNAESQRRMFMPFGLESIDAQKLVLIMIAVIALMGLILLPVILRLKLASGLDAAGRQWQLFRRKLERAGVPSSAAMTPYEVSEAANASLATPRHDINRISRLYRDIRYAPDGPEVAELETAVRNFKVSANTR